MDQKILNTILLDLKQEIDAFTQNTQSGKKPSQIELDILLDKLRRGYDELRRIDLSDISEYEAEQPKKEEKLKTDKHAQPEKISIPAEIDEDIHKTESETSEIDTDELMIDTGKQQPPVESPDPATLVDLFSGQEIPEQKTEPTPKENDVKPDEIKDSEKPEPLQEWKFQETDNEPETKSQEEPIKELKSEENPEPVSIAEKMQQSQHEETVADKIKKNKISSLKIAIGINEKFFFINELFNGRLKDYNSAIETLDQKPDLQQAINFIEVLQQQNMWDPESDAFKQLRDFLERKFV